MKINPHGTPNCVVLDVTDKTVRLVSLTPGLFKLTFVVDKPEVLAAFAPQAQVAVSFDVSDPPPPPDDGLSLSSQLRPSASLIAGINSQPSADASPLPTTVSSNLPSGSTATTGVLPPGVYTPPPPPATATPGFPVAKIDQIHDLLGVGAGVAYYNEGDPVNTTATIVKRSGW